MKRTFGRRINDLLEEGPGRQFTDNKWRFLFPVVCGFTLLNAIMTTLVFSDGGRLQSAIGAVMISIGGLVAWLYVAATHYSDSSDRKLAIGVSALDSIALLFVVGHLAFLLYVFGHLKIIQAAEADYKARAEAYNAKAERISDDNKAIAASAERIEAERTKRARIENDSLYQARKAAQAGAKVEARPGSQIGPQLATVPIELEKPKAPAESSVAFLAGWDAWIRILNFGELALAVLTLIFIRNRSAATNSPVENSVPMGTLFSTAAYRSPLTAAPFFNDTVSEKRDDTDDGQKTTRVVNREGLRRLRETLKAIGFQTKTHFKSDPKDDYIWVRQFRSSHGEARTVGACRARLDILDDAMTMDRAAFRERLEKFLRQSGFEI